MSPEDQKNMFAGNSNSGKKHPPTTRNQVKMAVKREKVWALYKQGFTLQQIADTLGYASRSGAAKLLRTALKYFQVAHAEDFAKIELDRLNDAHKAMSRIMITGTDAQKIRAALAIVRISESKRDLFGIDAPSQTTVELHNNMTFLAQMTDEQIDAIIEKGKSGKKPLTYDSDALKIVDAKEIEDLQHGNGQQRGHSPRGEPGQGPAGD